MADKKNGLPKVPPFITKSTPDKATQEPVSQPRPQPTYRPPARNSSGQPSDRGMLSIVVLLISLISLGIAMLSGAKFAYDIFIYKEVDTKPEQVPSEPKPTPEAQEQAVGEATPEALATEEPAEEKLKEEKPGKYEGAFSKIIVIGLAYIVGWLFTAYGIRVLGNLILPIFINIYAWIILGGILILQFAIIYKLFAQEYNFMSFVRYVSLFSAGLIALVGLHLVLQGHKLVFFGIPILLTSLAHLFLVVFHFVFMPEVKYEKLWGDLVFFMITTTVSMLMLAHIGILNGFRNFMDRTFNPKDNHFVPRE